MSNASEPSDLGPKPFAIRPSRRARRGSYGIALLFGGFAMYMLISSWPPPWFVGLFFLAFFLGVLAIARGPRTSAVGDKEGLVLRNWFSSRRIRWEEIEGFDVEYPTSGGEGATAGSVTVHVRNRKMTVMIRVAHEMSKEEIDDLIKSLHSWVPAALVWVSGRGSVPDPSSLGDFQEQQH